MKKLAFVVLWSVAASAHADCDWIGTLEDPRTGEAIRVLDVKVWSMRSPRGKVGVSGLTLVTSRGRGTLTTLIVGTKNLSFPIESRVAAGAGAAAALFGGGVLAIGLFREENARSRS